MIPASQDVRSASLERRAAMLTKVRKPILSLTLTRAFAVASAQDAANSRMRKAGRTTWNHADYNLASRTLARLLKLLGKP